MKRLLFALVATLGLTAALFAAPIDDLEAHWAMESNGDDSHSGNHDLTGNNSPAHAAGKVGNAFDVERDGNPYYAIADNADLSFGASDTMTVGFWTNPETVAGYTPHPVAKGDGSNQEYLFSFRSSGLIDFIVYGSAGFANQGFTTSTSAVSVGVWTYVMAGYRAATDELWIMFDCVEEDTSAHSAGIYDGTGNFQIGRWANDTASEFDGIVDEVSVWRADKSGDCATIRNSGSGLAYPWGGGSGAPRLLLLGVGE